MARGTISTHHQLDIAGLDDEFVTRTAVDDFQDLRDFLVSQTHEPSPPVEFPSLSIVAARLLAAARSSGMCVNPCCSVMRASGAETASAATGCFFGPSTGTATHTTPARNSWSSVETPVSRIFSSSASRRPRSVMVFSVYR